MEALSIRESHAGLREECDQHPLKLTKNRVFTSPTQPRSGFGQQPYNLSLLSLSYRLDPLHDLISAHRTGLSSGLFAGLENDQTGNARDVEAVPGLIRFGV